MGQKPSQPQIFNPALRQLRRERALRRDRSFLLERCAEDAAERIMDINRQFESAVIIGLPVFEKMLLKKLPASKTPKSIVSFTDWPQSFADSLKPDLIISALVLQSLDRVPQAVTEARRILQPDGLFLSALLGGESLLALRRACFAADQKRYGGIIPRIAPMIDVQQAAGLLRAAGLALPVIDRDGFTVSYKLLETLVSDLRDIGEVNNLSAYSPRYEGRDFFENVIANYTERDDGGRFKAALEILWMTAWKPHESQQKPLKPGSAKTRLSHALRQIKQDRT